MSGPGAAGRAHVTAVRARLDAELPESVTVRDGDVRDGALPDSPYVVDYSDTGRASAPSLAATPSHVETVVRLVACGDTAEQARWCAQKVTDALAGWRPTLTGRTSWPVTQEYSQPVALDRDVVERPIYYAALGFRVRSRAAS